MQALSGLDASFLYLETSKTPMHVAGLYILGPSEAGKAFEIEAFRAFIQSRLQVARIFRQKIVSAPFALSHPYWVEDEAFDLDKHLTHLTLPAPGDQHMFLEMVQPLFEKKLHRDRPLWEMYVIEGFQDKAYPAGSVGVLVKVHHAAIDGGSGAEIMEAFYDASPLPRKMPPDTWKPEPTPTGWALAQMSMFKSMWTKPLQANYFLLDSLQRTLIQKENMPTHKEVSPPIALMSAPYTILNTEISEKRVFDGITVPLAEIQKIKNAFEGLKLNDVLLSVCAGAVRRYLDFCAALPKESLVAMCPKSVRPSQEKGKLGNRVSAMLVSLATDEPDPVQRLLRIHKHSISAKVHSSVIHLDEVINLSPSGLTSAVAHLYQSLKISKLHQPFCNLTITNVIGPPMPLYMNGSKLLNNYGLGPITDGMGLLIALFTYNQQVMISATSCPHIISDMGLLMQFISEEIAALQQAVSEK